MLQHDASAVIANHVLIQDLDDVEAYARRLAKANPSLAREIELAGPGLDDLELAALRRTIPGLPRNYVRIAERWDLENVSIGYLNLRPPRFGGARDLSSCLIAANSSANPHFPVLLETRLIEVADWEGDPICLAPEGTGRAGHVFRLALAEDVALHPRFLARSFEDLLKGATELHRYSMSGPRDRDADALIHAISRYIPDLAMEEWRFLASMTI